MKTNLRIFLFASLVLCFSCGMIMAQAPVALAPASFNFDCVAENSPVTSFSTASMPGGDVVYASTYPGAPAGTGMPTSNTVTSGALAYQLQPYNGNNALQLGNFNGSSGTMTFSTPQTAAELHFLAMSVYGNTNVNIVVNFADNTTEQIATNFSVNDWFNGTSEAYVLNGRITYVNTHLGPPGQIYNVNSGNPRLYTYGFTISPSNQAKDIISVEITRTGGPYTSKPYFFAISSIEGASCTAPAPEIASDNLSGDPILLDVTNGNAVTINGSFTAGCGTHTIEVNWDDPNNPGTVNASVDETAKTYSSSNTFTQTGVYMAEITITDEENQSTSYLASVPILVYDFRCGSGRLNASFFDPTDGLKTIIGTEAKYNSSTGFAGFSDFEFVRKSGSTVLSRFQETTISALVISGNTATITGEGRFEVGGAFSGPATHDFTITFQEVATDQLQTLTISEKGTGTPAYSLDGPVSVQANRVKVLNTGGCRFAEQEMLEAVSVYPNPFSQSFVVEFSDLPEAAYELRVLNAMGQEVYQTVSDQIKTKLPLNYVAAGIYFLQVRQGATVTTTKLVKE